MKPPFVICYENQKRPVGYDWANNSVDAAELAKRLANNPNANVGILLGQETGFIDVECDGETATKHYAELFGDIKTPSWSSMRGDHHLFKYDARLAELPGTLKLPSMLEFRLGNGKAVQSIIPPSVVDGIRREWITSIDECEPAPVPDHVIDLLLAMPREKQGEHRETSIAPASYELVQRAINYVRKAEMGLTDGRKNAAFALAGHLFSFVDENGGRLSENQIVDLMTPWASTHLPPLPADVLREKVHNAMTYTPRADKVVETRIDLNDLLPATDQANMSPKSITKYTFGELRASYPILNPPVVDGLIREGETANIISYSKVGKSWLAYNLALSVISGRAWLDRFATSAGNVLLVDNELQPANLASRIPAVADAMGMTNYSDKLEVWPLRGSLRSLEQLTPEFARIEHGQFKLIILDAAYRFHLASTSENDNAAMAQTYNLLDRIAAHTGAAIALVHHTSKGNQSNKRVTDVGAGAGAQSRAADCHLVLREHADEGTVVLEAAVRSFKPVQPMTLRWDWPLWKPADADPTQLKIESTQSDKRQDANDVKGMNSITDALHGGPLTLKKVRAVTGFSEGRVIRLAAKLEQAGMIVSREVTAGGRVATEYSLGA